MAVAKGHINKSLGIPKDWDVALHQWATNRAAQDGVKPNQQALIREAISNHHEFKAALKQVKVKQGQ